MPGADGYITYSTKLDNSDLEKDLSSTTKKIESLEKQLQKNSVKRLPSPSASASWAASWMKQRPSWLPCRMRHSV